jgi:hypothetical protein
MIHYFTSKWRNLVLAERRVLLTNVSMVMSSLNSLWQFPTQDTVRPFHLADFEASPETAQAYLRHAIAEGTPLARAVRLTMTGEIKLKGWLPFTATQVVRADGGFVWSARVQKGLMFITGFDKFVERVGEMRWKLLGLFPVMTGSGPDISRSAGDRFAIERIMLPSALCRPEVRWTSEGGAVTAEEPRISPITLGLNPTGAAKSVSMLRWGNPDGGAFGLFPFGGLVEEEKTWGGYTIPSRLRIGWHFGTDRFEEGEFFRAQITSAESRL